MLYYISTLPSAASFYVPNLPGLHQDSEHPLHVYAGHILSDPNAAAAANTDVLAHLFFVMVKARRASDKERLMFWFNGGPGCSSFDGLMMEVGPWKVDGEGGLITADGGWEEYTTMVYIDQPAGTGLSYTSTDHYIHTLSEASEHILEFLRTFYKIFPEYQSVDTYLGGESYAGQYIPYFANAILASSIQVPLRGIAIGNGWIDARSQYPAYLDYAVKHGLVEDNSEQYRKGKQTTDECMAEFNSITGPEPIHVGICEGLALSIPSNNQKIVDGKLTCTNVYDVRLQDTFPACGMNWPPELKNVTSYLARKDVINALHASAKSTSWVECFGRVSQELRDQLSPSAITLLPNVLEKIPVLLFAGDQDFICNYMGIESMIKTMNWNGETGLGVVKTQSWSVEGSPAGTWVSSRNLTYVKIFNASHMAPYDVPNVAHDMILRFMGMNFSAIVDGSAHIPSTVGEDVKPVFNADLPVPTTPTGKTPEQNQAMWEAYYNAGSIALIVVIIACAVALCLWCRLRRRHIQLPKRNLNAEENIPLNSTSEAYDFEDRESQRKRKGKQRADESEPSSPIFDVGDDEDDSRSEDERRQ
ncbi:carboxypeptidase KEX1 [Serpula lacrymans var. lacrymans S7.9]|uniref:Carboxypeptidase n=1 Tax=Serpula lacrymans var. lacrymans (strain S7.9) TaxID=578457 RepID=F8NPW4_SERL9|nr:carboxypeptidase KEX1 [Serpula lacrymans var. lacrymans S7.9]EGO27752.1 carboxypeptidase KEX1 [Serpula lacrymans var. lacrymans S7.9]